MEPIMDKDSQKHEEELFRKNEEGSPVIRKRMHKYWDVFAPSLESMLLSPDAPNLDGQEQKEMMEYLPRSCYIGKKVLEMGAGIGRYTSVLSDAGVAHVTSVDFVQSFIDENIRVNGHKNNVTLLCADVTKLSFPPHSLDLVFGNWLLMYLSNIEVLTLLHNILTWLRPGGYFFVRESCYHFAGTLKLEENPTLYRTPLDYINMLSKSCAEGTRYTLLKAKNVQTYIRLYSNPNQVCFLLRRDDITLKAGTDADGSKTTQETLQTDGQTCIVDSNEALRMYDTDRAVAHILLGEALGGKTWCSDGGREVAEFMASLLPTVREKSVLLINCGSGGQAFSMADQGATLVHGMTSTLAQLHFAILYQGTKDKEVLQKVSFEVCRVCEFDGGASYDIVCAALPLTPPATPVYLGMVLNSIKVVLKPGGRLLLAAYTTGESGSLTADTLQSGACQAGYKKVGVSACPVLLPALTSQLTSLTEGGERLSEHPEVVRAEYEKELRQKVEQLQSGVLEYSVLQARV